VPLSLPAHSRRTCSLSLFIRLSKRAICPPSQTTVISITVSRSDLDDPMVHSISGKFGDRSHTNGFHDSVLVKFHGAR
jgi:hypothetical protein